MRIAFTLAFLAAAIFLIPLPAEAQSVTLSLGEGESGNMTGRIIQMIVLVGLLSVAPGLVIMVTCFTRIVVVLSLVRTALGLQQTPPNMVLVSLALFLSAFIMQPVLQQAWTEGLQPLVNEEINEQEAFERIADPFREFMEFNVREKDLAFFSDLERGRVEEEPAEATAGEEVQEEVRPALHVLVPAFMISELRRAFEIGFLLFIPFLVIDMVVAAVLMSMGMMMLPPVMIALPFKIGFFVLVDGWYLIAGSMVRSYGLG